MSTAKDLESISVGPTFETVNNRWNERKCFVTADDTSDMKPVLATNRQRQATGRIWIDQWVRHKPGVCKHPQGWDWRLCDFAASEIRDCGKKTIQLLTCTAIFTPRLPRDLWATTFSMKWQMKRSMKPPSTWLWVAIRTRVETQRDPELRVQERRTNFWEDDFSDFQQQLFRNQKTL